MSAQVSYGESAGKAKSHAHGMAQAIFGDHPVASAVFVAILILVILVLAFYLVASNSKADGKDEAKPSDDSFNSGWSRGSSHAGSPFEHMTTYADRGLRCGPGERVTPMPSTIDADGNVTAGGVYCGPESYAVDPNNLGCGKHWDPQALEEIAALSGLGGLEGSVGTGENRLHHAIDSGEDGYTLSKLDRKNFTQGGMKF